MEQELQRVLLTATDRILTSHLGKFHSDLSLSDTYAITFTIACLDIHSDQVSVLLHLALEQDKLLVPLMVKQLHLGKILTLSRT